MHKLGLKRLIQNSVGTLIRQLGAGVLQLFTVIVIARSLGPEGNGQFAIALLLPTILYQFLAMGMPTANAHFISSNNVSVRTAFDTSVRWFTFLVPVGLAIGALSIWLAGSQWFPGVASNTLWLALAIYPILLLQVFLVSIFQGLQNFKAYNIVLLLQPAIALVLSLALVAIGLGNVTAMMAAYLVGALVALAASYLMLYHQLYRTASIDSEIQSYGQRIIRYALKSHLGIALAFFNYRVDVYLLNLLGDTAGTGLYVIATQMVEKLWLLSAAVGVVMLPLLSQLASEEEKRRKLTPLMYIFVLSLTGLAGIATGILAVPIISMLFGADYADSALVMQLLLPGVVAWSGARVLAHDIAARGKPELNIYMNLGVLLINVIGNILLIPKYGMSGAAVATTVAYILFSVQMTFVYTKVAKTNWKSVLVDFIAFNKEKIGSLLS
ncbi:oligosaccharide flippase family protein [Leptothoe spongobia]|uniref:Oligosaccharide flippase family protein n=1 Tax=Leptothoe spongobia TAU-MAC 1115 TaxID=1967444 RepID=A0A947DF74_9CYAN|nr:oligosaccharide flippase family protein [Leptothoe spongobia]MBT9315660.1 oligosaccharide flippase family protein [Leptothoe spongobia TAU-MAC 1115]